MSETRLLPQSEITFTGVSSTDQNARYSIYSLISRDIVNLVDDDCSTSEDAISLHPISIELLKPDFNSESTSVDLSVNPSCN